MADERERQTSNKAGMRSLGKKLQNSRYGFNEHPGSSKTAGAFGREEMRGAGDESSPGSTRPSKSASLTKMKRGV